MDGGLSLKVDPPKVQPQNQDFAPPRTLKGDEDAQHVKDTVGVSTKGSYSYQHTSTHNDSTTQAEESSYTETYSNNVDQGAKQAYDRDVKNWKESNGFIRAALDIDQWAANQGKPYSEMYRKERDQIVPNWMSDKKF